MLLVNGCPKSGTHAVMSWLNRLGLSRHRGTVIERGGRLTTIGLENEEGAPLSVHKLSGCPDTVFILSHVPSIYAKELGKFAVITVFRDPRNVLVSYCRYKLALNGQTLTLIQAMEDFWGQPFVEAYRSYLGWRGKSVIMNYENLPSSKVGDGSELYDGELVDWNTRTGAPSKWWEWWDDQTEEVWCEAGGQNLVDAVGYLQGDYRLLQGLNQKTFKSSQGRPPASVSLRRTPAPPPALKRLPRLAITPAPFVFSRPTSGTPLRSFQQLDLRVLAIP